MEATGRVRLGAAEGDASGTLVIAAEDVAMGYGGAPVIENFFTRILRGDRIGIVGPNGAGKTTLLNLLTGALAPDAGTVKLGAGLQLVSLDQRRESLDPDATLAATLTGGRGDTVFVGDTPRHVIGYMKDFLFVPEQARTPVGALSGGERGRLMLARALAKKSNLLVLDEPTNDLDLETLDLLQEVLADYAGTILVVSHDRDFLDRVVTATIAHEGAGRWQYYAGGYSDMVAQRGHGVRARATASAAATERAATTPRADAPAAKRRLSFKEKHALDTLPGQIEKLTARLALLRRKLADPDLYARDRAGFTRLGAELAETETALHDAEESWLVLEALREDIEGG